MKSFKSKALLAAACAIAIVVVGATPAWAASYSTSGTFNCNGGLGQHASYRAHVSGNVSTFKLTELWWTSNTAYFGLRNTANVQVTYSRSWTPAQVGTTKNFTNTTNGTTQIYGTSLALNFRLPDGAGCVPAPSFVGTLNI